RLNDEKYQLSWIPYNEFQNIREIGKGGFATVYYARWLDKNRNYWSDIVLKLIHNSNKHNQGFINE
ncbi:3542_t:CDS:1, partial [Racocetra fulgida]